MPEDKKKCSVCYGYGWWPIGDLSPIGPMDSREWGDHVVKCPWCNMPYNGDDKGERYEALVKAKKNMEDKNDKSK